MASAHMGRIWLVFHLSTVVTEGLVQGRAMPLQRNESEPDGKNMLLFVPGLQEVADAMRLRDHFLSKIERGGHNVDCVVFNYQPNMTETYAEMLYDICDVEDNIGGAYLHHFVAAAQWKPERTYAYFLLWGPRLWVTAQTFDLLLLKNIMHTNNASAIGPGIEQQCCPSDNSTTQSDRPCNGTRKQSARDQAHMFSVPHNDPKIVGRMMPFVEWQATLFSRDSFQCLATHIKKIELSYWGSDLIFPTVCKARVGVVDLANLTVRKCKPKKKSYRSTNDLLLSDTWMREHGYPDYKRPGRVITGLMMSP